jgi:hypothetical protein
VIQILDEAQVETEISSGQGRLNNPEYHRRRRTYKPKNWFDGGDAQAPDNLDRIYYKDLNVKDEDMNTLFAQYTHMANNNLVDLHYGGRTAEETCELSCSLLTTKCIAYAFGEIKLMGPIIHTTKWGIACNLIGPFTDKDFSEAYRQNLAHGFWDGFTLEKGSEMVEEELSLIVEHKNVALGEVRNMKLYLKKFHDLVMPSTVIDCFDGKELVKFSNGGTACEDKVNWDEAPCNKLRPSIAGADKYGYGCRGALFKAPDPGSNLGNWNDNSGITSSSACTKGSWYTRCCSYDREYDVCYPRVTDCKIWPKQIYHTPESSFQHRGKLSPMLLARSDWNAGPCMYAVEKSGKMSIDICKGGNTEHNEGKYMWFKKCCKTNYHILNKDNPRCNTIEMTEKEKTPEWQLVFPRKKGQTYYYN